MYTAKKGTTTKSIFLSISLYVRRRSDIYRPSTSFAWKKSSIQNIEESREKNSGFGYGIEYQNVHLTVFDAIKNPFITDMYRHIERLRKLKRKDVAIVIHDPGEISCYNEPYLKYWNIITIRKSMQSFLQENFGIESQFLCHN
jgi:hypothetical protein